ncbi:hypothetical protein F5B19DRAFT_161414 [Rostrohypoxylon terebratum]|nr:hypothetical protein F5B19DRAFT_161414 [Rostrohypoxylon terebratum]
MRSRMQHPKTQRRGLPYEFPVAPVEEPVDRDKNEKGEEVYAIRKSNLISENKLNGTLDLIGGRKLLGSLISDEVRDKHSSKQQVAQNAVQQGTLEKPAATEEIPEPPDTRSEISTLTTTVTSQAKPVLEDAKSHAWDRILTVWQPELDAIVKPKENEKISFDSLQRTLHKMQEESNNGSKIFERILPFLRRLDDYSTVLDVFAQSHTVFLVLWGGIKTLLLISMRHKEILESLASYFEKVERHMPRYDIYLRQFPASKRIEEAMVNLYEELIKFSIQSCKIYGSKASKLFLLSGATSERKRVQDSLARIEECKKDIELEANAAHIEISGQRHEELKTLLEKERKSSYSPTLFPCHVIPYPRNPRFQGRVEMLKKMEDFLNPSQTETVPRYLTICGLGGVGKTQTALEFAYRYKDIFDVILWATADTGLKLDQAYASFATALGIQSSNGQSSAEQVKGDVKKWLCNIDKPWLLVLDNVDDPKLVASFLPSTNKGSILLTTRNTSPMFTSAKRTFVVETLNANDSLDLFLSQLALDEGRDEPTDDEVVLTQRICKELGGLPLAITQVVGFLVNAGCTLEEAHEIFQNREYADAFLHGEQEPVDSYYEFTLSNVWDVTFSKLSSETSDFLNIISFLDPDAITEQLFEVNDELCSSNPGLSFLRKRIVIFRTLANLKAQDIIKRNPEKKYFSIHRLIKAWIMQRMDDERWQSSFGRVVDLLYDKFPRQNMGMPLHSSHKICDTFLPHVLSVASNLRNPVKHAYADKLVILLHNATWYMFERGWFKDLLPYSKIAIKLLEDMDKLQTLEAALIINTIGTTCIAIGKPSESLEHNQRVFDIRKSLLPPTDPALLNSLHNVSYSYAGLGDYVKAKEICKEALTSRENLPDSTYGWYKKASIPRNYVTYCRICFLSEDIESAERYGWKAVELAEVTQRNKPHAAL